MNNTENNDFNTGSGQRHQVANDTLSTNLFIAMQRLLPQHKLSRALGYIARARAPWLKRILIAQFIKRYQVDLSEAVIDTPQDFACFNDFFCRELKPTCRPIDPDLSSITSPADGEVSQLGTIDNSRIFQAKGQTFTTQELLGGNTSLAEPFTDGKFATIYLSPRDYHRVHMPLAGTLVSMTHIPGKLFSVNTATAEHVPRLFARNERVVAMFDTACGPMALVLVGAMIVASIDTVWAGQVAPTSLAVSHIDYGANTAIELTKGQEMGRFKLGSTVIMLLPQHSIDWHPQLSAGSPVKMGASIASIARFGSSR